MNEPRPDGGGSIHVAIWVPHEQAGARIAAALAAGGRMVRDEFAPSWWTLADAWGNEAISLPQWAATDEVRPDQSRSGHATCIAVYDRPLTIEQVLTQLNEQPEAIAALTAGLPRARLHGPPSRGEWSVNDVLAHLRSCADMWGRYIAMIVAEDRPTIRAMNPTTWIKSTNYPQLEFAPSFRAFAKQRAELLALLRPLPKAAWSCSATVTGAGRPRERTVLDYARWLANHERSHVKHIARIVSG